MAFGMQSLYRIRYLATATVLSCLSVQGQSIDPDTFAELRTDADQGRADAQALLGWCYSEGKGVPSNQAEAVKWYAKAANQGNAGGQFRLGIHYISGIGVEKNEKEGAKWLMKSSMQGNMEAQNTLANCYVGGIGVEKSDTEAVKWFRKAADQGYADAQYNIGSAYGDGKILEKDDSKSIEFYLKAAQQGHTKAQNYLAIMYIKGMRGLERNESEGYKWILISSILGDKEAKERINLVEKTISAESKDNGKQLALDWLRNFKERKE